MRWCTWTSSIPRFTVFLNDKYQLEIGHRVTVTEVFRRVSMEEPTGRWSEKAVFLEVCCCQYFQPGKPGHTSRHCFQLRKCLQVTDAYQNGNTMDIYTVSFIASIFGWWRARVGTLEINSINLIGISHPVHFKRETVLHWSISKSWSKLSSLEIYR